MSVEKSIEAMGLITERAADSEWLSKSDPIAMFHYESYLASWKSTIWVRLASFNSILEMLLE